jgi:hypothetical protein
MLVRLETGVWCPAWCPVAVEWLRRWSAAEATRYAFCDADPYARQGFA